MHRLFKKSIITKLAVFTWEYNEPKLLKNSQFLTLFESNIFLYIQNFLLKCF